MHLSRSLGDSFINVGKLFFTLSFYSQSHLLILANVKLQHFFSHDCIHHMLEICFRSY